MIPLNSPRWSELRHCYGPATDTPGLLRDLESFPEGGTSEPWFALWSSLCHQGDVFPASFAAVPHIVSVLATNPSRATRDFFLLPACIEIARANREVPVPEELRSAYQAAIRRLPELVGQAASKEWDESFLACAMTAMAVGKGHVRVAEAVLEMDSNVAKEFLDWFMQR